MHAPFIWVTSAALDVVKSQCLCQMCGSQQEKWCFGVGINQWNVDEPPRYLSNTHLAARVGGLNPRWNEDSSNERTDTQFEKAVQLTGSEFMEAVGYLAKVGFLDSKMLKRSR